MIDLINHPPHYKGKGIESIDVIEAFGLGFRLGNTVKYILRHQRKGTPLYDLKKARWYLDREIAILEKSARLCLIAGCHRKPRCKGLCDTHRKRLARNRPLDTPVHLPRGRSAQPSRRER